MHADPDDMNFSCEMHASSEREQENIAIAFHDEEVLDVNVMNTLEPNLGFMEEQSIFEEAEGGVHDFNEGVVEENTPVGSAVEVSVVKKLLSGKMIEGLSWHLGNQGVKYLLYRRLARSFNVYTEKCGERKFPSYDTVLRMTYKMLSSCVFVRQRPVTANVNTARSGVPARFSAVRRAGATPTITFHVVSPSEWGARDLVQYNFLTQKPMSTVRLPGCLNIENAPLLGEGGRECFPMVMYEVTEDSFGYSTGEAMWEGSEIQLSFECRRDIMENIMQSENGQHVHAVESPGESLRRSMTVSFRGKLGRTRFCNEVDHERGLRPCDAITSFTLHNGSPWKDVLLVHKFSPPPGILSTFLSIKDRFGHHLQLQWSDIRRPSNASATDLGTCQSPFGMLQDGRRYSVLRFLLYTDDFRPFAFRQASCGGLYILPLSIPPMDRAGVSIDQDSGTDSSWSQFQ